MKPVLPVFRLFPSDTAADLDDLQSYLLSCPGYAQNAYNHGKSTEHIHLLGHVDRVESAIRQFVSGAVNNLTSCRSEVNDFYQCRPDAAPRMTAFALDSVLAFLVEGEFYEAVSRLNLVRQHLQRRFGVITEGDYERLTQGATTV
ncbi:MAG: hypothetical protein EAZ91_07455 [Cytophagales bacterium]|nr:MAG: hypothetical protein EAZ91_07455 [Cytophagales bacterium]